MRGGEVAGGRSFSRARPGSPWMPTPTSISSSGRSKPGLPAAGVVHGGERDRERRRARVDAPGDGGDRGEGGALLGERAGDLLDEQGRAGAAAPGGPGGAVDRDVVVDEDASPPRMSRRRPARRRARSS